MSRLQTAARTSTEAKATPGAADPAAAIAALGVIAASESLDLEVLVFANDPARSSPLERGAAEPPALLCRKVLLDEGLQREFLEVVRTRAAELADLTPRAYAPAAEISRGEVMHAAASVGLLPTVAEQLRSVSDHDVFDADEPYASRLRLLTIIVSEHGKPLGTFHRELKPTAWLERSRSFALLWGSGRFNRLHEHHVLLFDRKFDAFIAEGYALFTARGTFERIFALDREMAAGAKGTFDTVLRILPIRGLDELERLCLTNRAMMWKLASIQRHLDTVPGYAEAMSADRLTAFVRAHPEYGVELAQDEPGVQGSAGAVPAEFIFSSDPAHRFKILRLLDDDYLASFLTNRAYEANSKSEPLS